MLMYITDVNANSTAEFDQFALFNTVQSRDEAFVFRIGDGIVARQ